MIILRIVLTFIMLSGTAAAAELCADHPRSIEPDMQIQEADLSTEAAQKAVSQLQELLREAPHDHVMHYGVLNRLQILRGYTLRQQAIEDRAVHGTTSQLGAASTETFCAWMDKGAFWYD